MDFVAVAQVFADEGCVDGGGDDEPRGNLGAFVSIRNCFGIEADYRLAQTTKIGSNTRM